MQRFYLVSIPIVIVMSPWLMLQDAFATVEVFPFVLGNVVKSCCKTQKEGPGRIAAVVKSLLFDLAGIFLYAISYLLVTDSLVALYPELN